MKTTKPTNGTRNGTRARRPGPVDVVSHAPQGHLDPDPHEWIKKIPIETSADVEVPTRLMDQVIGQDEAVATALKAAEQKRNLMLIGDPGTGKSMIAQAMAQVLPRSQLPDVVAYGNAKNPNNPKVMTVEGGNGRLLIKKYERLAQRKQFLSRVFDWTLVVIVMAAAVWATFIANPEIVGTTGFLFVPLILMMYIYYRSQNRAKVEGLIPNLLVENGGEEKPAPYVDGTGSHAGALLGDVKHDPFQSGGLQTPPHARVDSGAIHRANRGVLFIDEINVLRLASQQALLTAMQERAFAITGQSQTSSGSNVRTEPVPCDFILVAAGNQDALEKPDGLDRGMHPALRSRIRGYGYEVFVNSVMPDTHLNRAKLVRFVQQEVAKDGRVPPFERGAIAEILREAQRRSGRTGKLTLRLRELGGLVRSAGDVANTLGEKLVTVEHVRTAKRAARSMEQQMTDTEIQDNLEDLDFLVHGSVVGTANGVGIIGTGDVGEPAGIVTAVEAAVVPALSRSGGAIVLGAGLREQSHHGIENVGALLKTLKGAAIADHDLHLDAHVAHPNAKLDGIGIASAVAAISALESMPVRQDHVMIGNVTVSGEIRPVRATLQRIEAASKVGYRVAIVPASIEGNLVIDDYISAKIKVVYCADISEVLKLAGDAEAGIMKELRRRLKPGQGRANGKGDRESLVSA